MTEPPRRLVQPDPLRPRYDIDAALLTELEGEYPGISQVLRDTLNKPSVPEWSVWLCYGSAGDDETASYTYAEVSDNFATCRFVELPTESFSCLYFAPDADEWWRDIQARLPLFRQASEFSILSKDAEINLVDADDAIPPSAFDRGLTQVLFDRWPSQFWLSH